MNNRKSCLLTHQLERTANIPSTNTDGKAFLFFEDLSSVCFLFKRFYLNSSLFIHSTHWRNTKKKKKKLTNLIFSYVKRRMEDKGVSLLAVLISFRSSKGREKEIGKSIWKRKRKGKIFFANRKIILLEPWCSLLLALLSEINGSECFIMPANLHITRVSMRISSPHL